jgi:hypothetical protein
MLQRFGSELAKYFFAPTLFWGGGIDVARINETVVKFLVRRMHFPYSRGISKRRFSVRRLGAKGCGWQ